MKNFINRALVAKKHLKLFFALFAMLALGVGNAWAEDYSIKFLTAATDGSTEIATSTKTSTVLESASCAYVTGFTSNCTKAYYKGKSGVKLSSKNAAGTIELTLSNTCNQNISKVVFKTVKYSSDASTLTFYAGTSTLGTIAAGSDFSHTFTTPQSVSTLKIESSKRAYISEIIISVSAGETPGGGETPEPDPDPTPDPEEPDTPGTGGESSTVTFTYEDLKGQGANSTGANFTGATKENIHMSGKGNGNNSYVQIYANNYLTFTPTNATITKIVLTATSGYIKTWSASEGTIEVSGDKATWTGNSTSMVTLTNTASAQARITQMDVTYTASGGGTEEPVASLTANPTSLDFGEVTQNDVVEPKTFTISGSNFTKGDLTITAPTGYTVNPTTVSVDGTLEEKNITVTPNTSEVNTYNGYVTISGANLKSSVTVELSMTVNKAPATPTENVYVKVTSTEGITDGEYLIVYEDATAPVAFNGALTTLDAVSNNIAVTINNNTIAGNTDIDAATFTIDATAKTIKSASGYYIGQTSDANGLAASDTKSYANDLSIEDDGSATIKSGGAYLRYNSDANQWRFRYYKSGSYSNQKAIALYKKASKHTVAIADCNNGSVSAKMGETSLVTNDQVLSGTQITLGNEAATGYKLTAYDVYKTGDATAKVTVTDGKFIMPEFDVTISATFELAKTLTGIAITNDATQTTFWQNETFNHNGLKVTAHFDGADNEDVTDKVTVTGSTATAGTAVEVTVSFTEGTTTKTTTYPINVQAIPNTKETAYTVADAYAIIDKLKTADGVFIKGIVSQVDEYLSSYKSITYWISDDGTTTKQLQAYSGKGLNGAEFSDINGVSKADQVIVCGNLKKHTDGTYEFNYNNYLVSQIKTTKADPELSYTTTEYNVNLGDAFTAPTLNNLHTLAVTYSSSNEDVATVGTDGAVTIKAAGTVVITASFAGNDDYVAGSASYTINITDPNVSSVTFDATIDKTADAETLSLTKDVITMTFTSGAMNNGENYRCYKNQTLTISATDASIQKIEFECTSSNPISGFADATGLDKTNSVWIGNAKSVELTASNNQVRMSKVNVYYKKDKRANAELAWSEETVSLTVGDAFTPPTLINPHSVSGITYKSSNEDVATVSADGVIALVDDAIGTATITATFAGDDTYKPATATCTITVNEYIETIDGEWELVTDASKLQAGMEIIIASVEVDGKYYTMSKASDNTNNRTAVESTISGEKLNPAVGTSVLTLVDAGNGTFALQASNGKYLYAGSSGNNYLKEKDEIDVHGQWTITIADNVATIKAEASSYRNWMQFNPNNGSPLFSCYADNKPQKDIALYAKVPEHRRTTAVGRYGTICLPGNIVKVLGATLYEVAGKEGSRVVFDEVLTPEAGMPYIFLAHNAEVLFYCGDQTAAAGNHKSLHGTFEVLQDAQLKDMYMVQNNKIVKCADTGCGVAAYRAYFNGIELEALGKPGAQMPGRKRITMGTESENAATGTEDVIAPEGQTLKLIENGQLIIIRNGEKFNAQGVRL